MQTSRLAKGAQWLIVDGSIIDVGELIRDDSGIHKGDNEVFRLSQDITGTFKVFHANLKRIDSVHKPGLSIMDHIREKIVGNVVGVLDTHKHLPPLSSPTHRFWKERAAGAPYYNAVGSSLAAEGASATACIVA